MIRVSVQIASIRQHYSTYRHQFGDLSKLNLFAGWFTQSEDQFLKEYSYAFSPHNTSYIEWRERTTRDGSVKRQTSLVFAARPYLDGVNVTERRNLVYNFRLVATRAGGSKGDAKSGADFPVALPP